MSMHHGFTNTAGVSNRCASRLVTHLRRWDAEVWVHRSPEKTKNGISHVFDSSCNFFSSPAPAHHHDVGQNVDMAYLPSSSCRVSQSTDLCACLRYLRVENLGGTDNIISGTREVSSGGMLNSSYEKGVQYREGE